MGAGSVSMHPDLPSGLAAASWIGTHPAAVPEFSPPEFDDRPEIARDLEPVRVLRRVFQVPTAAERADLWATARGVLAVTLDGTRLGPQQFAPGWTDYRRRLHVEHWPLGPLSAGPHVLVLELADGWWAGYLGMDRRHQAGRYGTHTSARALLTWTGPDGVGEVATGPDWHVGTGAIRYADLLMGQFTDQTAAPAGLHDPAVAVPDGFAPVWHEATLDVALEPRRGPAVVTLGERDAVGVDVRPDGSTVLDFGENLVGRVRLDLTGVPRGTRVHLRHAEILQDGEPYTDNLRTARAHDIVVADGAGTPFEPDLTFHGFRYAEVRGWPGPVPAGAARAVIVGSDVPRLATWACGDERVNRLHENIARTIRGNLLAVPTDCPQRDERLGWMGDAQLIMRTAHHLFDLGDFVGKWLVDVRDGQAPSGAYPDVAPREVVLVDGAPGWADAGVLVPWDTARMTGRTDLLAEHRDSMATFLEHLLRENPDRLRTRAVNRNYGDWLSLRADTPKAVLATAYLARSLDAMAATDTALGHDPARWVAAAAEVRAAFADAYVRDGVVHGQTQTGYATALRLGLVPPDQRAEAAHRLVADIRARDTHLSTGIHGLRDLLPALTEAGHLDVAYELLLRDDYPSWLFPLRHGATTVWERWDGWTAERGLQTPAMNSFNHYALGSVGQWLHEAVAGLAPAGLGFRTFVVRPHPSTALGWCEASRRTPDGEVSVRWEVGGGAVTLRVVVPPGHRAEVQVPTTVPGSTTGTDVVSSEPGWDRLDLTEGTHELGAAWDESWRPPATGPAVL